jgi:hypothetical protein
VTFPETSVRISIRNNAFEKCASLKSVTLSDYVFLLYDSVFYNCTSLPKITIPASVTKGIGASAFEGCTALDSVTCLVEEPYAFGNNAFKNISSKCVLTVPYGKRAAYIAKGWTTKIFKGGIVELPAPEGIQALKVNRADKGTYYDLEGRKIAHPEKGNIYICKGKKVLVR